MSSRIARRLSAVALAVAAALLLSVPLARGASIGVDIADLAFQPANVTVTVGDTVTWTNRDPMQHTITTTAGAPVAFDSGLVDEGGSFSYTFVQPGTYGYLCTPHPFMTGTVTVVAAPAPTAAPTGAAVPSQMPNASISGRQPTPSGLAARLALLVAVAGTAIALDRRRAG